MNLLLLWWILLMKMSNVSRVWCNNGVGRARDVTGEWCVSAADWRVVGIGSTRQRDTTVGTGHCDTSSYHCGDTVSNGNVPRPVNACVCRGVGRTTASCSCHWCLYRSTSLQHGSCDTCTVDVSCNGFAIHCAAAVAASGHAQPLRFALQMIKAVYSFLCRTHHVATEWQSGITQCYLSPYTGEHAPPYSQADQYLIYQSWWDGRLSWPWSWLHTEVVYLSTDSHPSY